MKPSTRPSTKPSTEPGSRSAHSAAAAYRILVQGRIDERWSEWFNDLVLLPGVDADGKSVTTLSGTLPDQAALRGLVNKLWDLNLTLVSLTRLRAELEDEGKQ
jgi:hypothetical protein